MFTTIVWSISYNAAETEWRLIIINIIQEIE